jgi:hypothetical protein
MAACRDCEQEMLVATSCTADTLIVQGQRYARDRVRRPIGPAGRSADCGVTRGGYDHLGCDLEDCPACRRQLISCGCGWEDETTESLVLVAGDTVVYPDSLRGQRIESGGGLPPH